MQEQFKTLCTSSIPTVKEPKYTELPYSVYLKDIKNRLSINLQHMVFIDLNIKGRMEYYIINLSINWDTINNEDNNSDTFINKSWIQCLTNELLMGLNKDKAYIVLFKNRKSRDSKWANFTNYNNAKSDSMIHCNLKLNKKLHNFNNPDVFADIKNKVSISGILLKINILLRSWHINYDIFNNLVENMSGHLKDALTLLKEQQL